jgi:hypothetical protein
MEKLSDKIKQDIQSLLDLKSDNLVFIDDYLSEIKEERDYSDTPIYKTLFIICPLCNCNHLVELI